MLEMQAKIDQAIAQKQKELANKKQRVGEKKDSSEEQKSAYLKQKSELEQLAGNKGEEASKWLVR
jgi:hypothetical protein